MNKYLIAATVALFMSNSPAMAEDGADLLDIDKMSTAERALKDKSAQMILNEMACKDKEPSDIVKDQTDGSTFACGQIAQHEVEVHSIQYGDKNVEEL